MLYETFGYYCHSLNSNEELVPHCIDTDDFDEDEEEVEKITKKDVNFAELVPQIPSTYET